MNGQVCQCKFSQYMFYSQTSCSELSSRPMIHSFNLLQCTRPNLKIATRRTGAHRLQCGPSSTDDPRRWNLCLARRAQLAHDLASLQQTELCSKQIVQQSECSLPTIASCSHKSKLRGNGYGSAEDHCYRNMILSMQGLITWMYH